MSDWENSESNNDKFLVSVVMPMFNASDTVRESVYSVLRQTHKNLELIIVDDCSTDSSYEIAEEMQKVDRRVNVIRLNKNSGAGFARNVGIEKSSGNYIAFLDADDSWTESKLEKQLLAANTSGAALVCTGYTIFNRNGQKKGNKQPPLWITHQDLLKSNLIGCLTALYSVDKIGKVYMPLIRKRQDYAMWLQITKKYGPAYCVQEDLAQYYILPNSISSNKFELMKWNFLMFYETQNYSLMFSLFFTLRNALIKIIRG